MFLFLAGLLVWPAVADAQSVERMQVYGIGGVTFSSETGAAIGGGVRARIGNLQPFAEIGWMSNVMNPELKLLSNELQEIGPGVFHFNVRSTYGLFGARYEFAPAQTTIRPYVEAGFGFARLAIDFGLEADDFEISTEDFPELDEPETEPMFAFGGGVGIPLRDTQATVEVGYRYSRILAFEPINVNQIYAGVRVIF